MNIHFGSRYNLQFSKGDMYFMANMQMAADAASAAKEIITILNPAEKNPKVTNNMIPSTGSWEMGVEDRYDTVAELVLNSRSIPFEKVAK